MSKDKFKDLIKKYEAGLSTLPEEQILSDNAKQLGTEAESWFKFIQHNKRKVPEGLQDTIWESIQRKRIVNRRLSLGIISAAASILLLLSLIVFNPFSKKQSYQMKEALLNEAINMFEDQVSDEKAEMKSIYEDDMIIIYASAE